MSVLFTPKTQDAIQLAIKAHAGQKRKGKDILYITHPLSVSLILARIGADEEVIIAGILHDTVEDTDVAMEDIEQQFGERVADLVGAVTEHDKSLPWAERKRLALEHISTMDRDQLLLKSADVLHNLSELVRDHEEQGEAVFDKFNAPKEKKLEQQQRLIKAFETAWPENPVLPEIKAGAEKLIATK